MMPKSGAGIASTAFGPCPSTDLPATGMAGPTVHDDVVLERQLHCKVGFFIVGLIETQQLHFLYTIDPFAKFPHVPKRVEHLGDARLAREARVLYVRQAHEAR